MKKVYTDENLARVWCIRNELELAGIACEVRNDMLSGAAGDIPVTECWPEIWIQNNQDLPRAEELVAEAIRRSEEPGEEWECAQCGERLGGQFGSCWNCGAVREV